MNTREKRHARILAVCGITLCILLSRRATHDTSSRNNPMAFMLGSSLILTQSHTEQSLDLSLPSNRVALRLRKRLHARGLAAPLEDVVSAVELRSTLFTRTLSVEISDDEGSLHTTWNVSPQHYPLWVGTRASGGRVVTAIDSGEILETIARGEMPEPAAPVDAELREVRDDKGILRATTDRVAKPGHVVDRARAALSIAAALGEGYPIVHIQATPTPGGISNTSGYDMKDFSLIGEGYSNFAGSPAGRVYNVRKALHDHVHNIIVPAGAEFSFNATLGGPVSERRGWKLAKVISAGELIMEPGGGICQVSTTVFRAILQAGLPIGARRSHSMYVSYYEKGGVGLDATVYYGQQDLKFTNDTGAPMLIQALSEGDDAHVYIYGRNDGRSVSMEGPFFSGAEPEDFRAAGKKLRMREIGWVREIRRPDGVAERSPIFSTYKGLPRSVVYKYTAPTDAR